MADYSIKTGDNLWNIAKSNYSVSSYKEIAETVKMISEENKLDDPSMIIAGSSLSLPETDSFIKTTQETQASQQVGEKTKADELQEWNSYDNAIKNSMGEEIPEFEMFDAKGQKMSNEEYFKALNAFSQSVIDKYDISGDGKMDEQEFGYMMTEGLELEEYAAQTSAKEAEFLKTMGLDANVTEMASALATGIPALAKTLFSGFQMDDDNTTIGSTELASQFFMSDLNSDGNVDGKLDFGIYNSYATDPSSPTYKYDVEDRKYMHDNVILPHLED